MPTRRPRLSVSIIAHNEVRELPGCLASVRGLADEVVVVDCASRDGTGAVAKRLGARVYRRPNLMNLNVNKAWGISKTHGEWVLYLDPDERLTAAGRREISRVIRSDDAADAYELPRRNFYFGRWLKWGGKYPDAQRRLFRRGRAFFPEKHLHERVTVEGSLGRLREPFDHHPYPDLDAFLRKALFYADFQAKFLKARGARPGFVTAVRYLAWTPARRFLSRYVFKLGFLDGRVGFLAAAHDTLTQVMTFAALRLRATPAGVPRRRRPA